VRASTAWSLLTTFLRNPDDSYPMYYDQDVEEDEEDNQTEDRRLREPESMSHAGRNCG